MSAEHLKPILAYIEFCYPKAYEQIQTNNLISKNLFSPFILELPHNLLPKIEKFVTHIYNIKEKEDYQKQITTPVDFNHWPKNKSVLTCFDFHYTEDQGLKLIEINTNASLYLPIILQRCGQTDQCEPPQFDKLLASFKEAFDLEPGAGISVFDAEPEKEGLFFEFLIFKEWFEQLGYDANIVSLANYSTQAKRNVYNRFTDFYLAEERSKNLYQDYLQGEKLFSPNPREYCLLADKRRLRFLRDQMLAIDPELATIIPETKLFKDFASAEDLWSQRKKFFFKPSVGFGSKGAFAGKGISRKAFDRLFDPHFIAQEYCPAGKRTFSKDGEEHIMKFDVRIFTFDGQIQNYGARLYQGQTTNMQTLWGGLAPVKFI